MAWSPEWSVSPHSRHHLFTHPAPLLNLLSLCPSWDFCPSLSLNILCSAFRLIKTATLLSFRSKPKCHLLFIESFFVQLRLSLSSWPKGDFPQLIFITYPVLISPVALNTTCTDLIHSLALYLLSFVQKHKLWEDMNLPILLPLVFSGTVPGREQTLSKYFENKLMIIYNLLMHCRCQNTMLNMLFF